MPEKPEAQDFIEGKTILFDKPYKKTSFSIVKEVRYTLQKKFSLRKIKVGHAGTLDPLATGLLIICTGKATKKISELQEYKKEYIATLKLGETTPSFDLESKVDEKYPVEHITIDKIQHSTGKFVGSIDQLPPLFSAKNINGIRAYEYARKGEKVNLKTSRVHIYSIEITHFELPFLTIKVECSKGTYIRSLARDLGTELKSGAHLTDLKRTAIGNYRIEDAFTVDTFLRSLN